MKNEPGSAWSERCVVPGIEELKEAPPPITGSEESFLRRQPRNGGVRVRSPSWKVCVHTEWKCPIQLALQSRNGAATTE